MWQKWIVFTPSDRKMKVHIRNEAPWSFSISSEGLGSCGGLNTLKISKTLKSTKSGAIGDAKIYISREIKGIQAFVGHFFRRSGVGKVNFTRIKHLKGAIQNSHPRHNSCNNCCRRTCPLHNTEKIGDWPVIKRSVCAFFFWLGHMDSKILMHASYVKFVT